MTELTPGDPLNNESREPWETAQPQPRETSQPQAAGAKPAGQPLAHDRPTFKRQTSTTSQPRGRVVVGVLTLLVLAVIAIGALSGGDDDERTSATASQSVQGQSSATPSEPATTPQVELAVTTPKDGATIRQGKVRVRGTVSPDSSTVTVEGRRAIVKNGRFSTTVKLPSVGTNLIQVRSTAPGHDANYFSREVDRKRSAAELAAIRERRRLARERREQARIQREATFKANAITIPFNQLNKSPERYAGDKVKYTGQIFQIQEAPSGGGLMLLSVTNEGYDFWSDQVWVNYEGRVQGAEEDIVTVYGTVIGSKSYDTQIGGERSVPELQARYIDE